MQHLLHCILLLFLLLPTSATDVPTLNSNTKGYTSKEETTVLYNYIRFRDYTNALTRLSTHPNEAFTLVEKRDFSRNRYGGGILQAQELPLHIIFGIDVPEHPAGHFTTDDHDDVDTHKMEDLQIKLAQELLKINPNAAKVKNHHGRTPLHLAAYSPISPPSDLLQTLIDVYPEALQMEDEDGRLPLHCATHQPAASTAVIKAIMELYPEALQVRDKEDDDALPIHLLSWGGHVNRSGIATSFQILHEAYPESLLKHDGDGDSPLLIMVKYGRTSLQMIKYALEQVLEHGDILNMRDIQGNSVLHAAVNSFTKEMKDDMIHLILETISSSTKGDVIATSLLKQTNDLGRTPLHSALEHGYSCSHYVIKMLLQGYKEATKMRDDVGFLPIHLASQFGVVDEHIIRDLVQAYPESLLEETKITMDHRDTNQIPLHLALRAYVPENEQQEAAGSDHLSTMDKAILYMIEANPKTCSIPDPNHDHQLPIHTAITMTKSHVLIDEIAQYYSKGIEEKTMSGGRTALHLLADESEGFDPKEAELIIKILLKYDKHGAQVADAKGLLPLHVAAMEPHWEKARKYVELMKAAHQSPDPKSRHVILDALLKSYEKGAQVKDKEGNIPLHHACRAHDAISVDMLLNVYDKGATVANEEGLLPLHIITGTTWHPSYELPRSDNEDDDDENDTGAMKDSPSDLIMKKLLELHPEAASVENDKGDLPLHMACSSLLAQRDINPTSLAALIHANPDAAVVVNPTKGNLPLHAAIRSLHGKNSHFAELIVKTLLDVHPDAANIADSRGSLPLHLALVYTHGDIEDHAEDKEALLRLLYDANPDAIKEMDGFGRMVAHAAARLVGETAGSTHPSLLLYVSFFEDMIHAYPEALTKLDAHLRTPLHNFCMHFSNSITSHGRAYKYAQVDNDALKNVIRLMIRLNPDAIDVEDKSGDTPTDMVKYDRVKSVSGEVDYGEKSRTFTYLARAIRLGSAYWRSIAGVEEAEGVDLVEEGWKKKMMEEKDDEL